MAVHLSYIGQAAMDNYYKDYKGNTGFFELDDFIFRAGATISNIYQQTYQDSYKELRQDKNNKEELVAFDTELLSVQELDVKGLESEVNCPVMSFLYDKSNTGYQFLLPIEPKDVIFERSTMDDLWIYDYLPYTNRIFWRLQNGKIKFFKNCLGGIKKVQLYYIPSIQNKNGEIYGDTMIADGLVDMAINGTVLKMRQIEQGIIVKKENDLNNNMTIETEINKEALK
jgi:hypothetical protein